MGISQNKTAQGKKYTHPNFAKNASFDAQPLESRNHLQVFDEDQSGRQKSQGSQRINLAPVRCHIEGAFNSLSASIHQGKSLAV